MSETPTDAFYSIDSEMQNDAYILTHNNKRILTKYPLQEIDRILFENTHYDKSMFALHGAAVSYNGKAYLFLAATTGGKTTLASYLSTSGFGYITDDCILLYRSNFFVYPLNTPIHLRDGGVEVLKKVGALPKRLEILDDVPNWRYIYTPTNCVVTELPLGKIFFITRTENENHIENMHTSERMTKLMYAPITDYKVIAEYVEFIAKLAQVDCKRLWYSDMYYVTEVIWQWQSI